MAAILTACDPPPAFVFGVNSTADRVDGAPGDGRCATAAPEVCTLRAAVMEANAQGEHTQVLLPAGTVRLTLGPGDENTGASDDLDVTAPLTITGDPAAGSTIDAGGVGRVLDVVAGTTTLDRVTITGGTSPSSGGGVQIRGGGRLVATDVTIAGNTAANGTGGLKVVTGATAELNRVTVSGNSGPGIGGIVNAGTLTAVNTTISGNTAGDGFGGGLTTAAPGSTSLTFVTIARNSGSGLDTTGGTTTTAGSIFANQLTGADCTGSPPSSTGDNLDSDGSCLPSPLPTDLRSSAADLGPLADNGGWTRTHRPALGSDAQDMISVGTAKLCDGSIPTDQRGRTRPTFAMCDIGAVETGDFVVNRSTDRLDDRVGDGVCEVTPGARDCTLRAAVAEANAMPGSQEIVLQTDVTLTRAGADGTNVSGDLDVSSPVVLIGGGHTVDGGDLDRVIEATAPLTIEHATITGGNLPVGSGAGIRAATDLTLRDVTVRDNTGMGNGGGIAHSVGALVVQDSTISGNVLAGSATGGGGIDSLGGSMTVLRSTIAGNEVATGSGAGGGIRRIGSPAVVTDSTIRDNRAGRRVSDPDFATISSGGGGGGISGPVTLTASTVSGNWSGGDGGGLSGGPTVIRRSTITGNEAAEGYWDSNTMLDAPSGRGGAADGTPTVIASTIVGNSASLEAPGLTGGSISGSIHTDGCGADVTSGGRNVLGEGCARNGAGDQVVAGAALPVVGALGDNGGPTATMLPATSILDGIPIGTAGLCDATVTTDQRGRPRPAGSACDAGAVERSAVATVDLVTNDSGDGSDATPGDGTCATSAGRCTLRAAVDEANHSAGADTITLGADATISRSGHGEDGNLTGDLDIVSDLTIEGGGHTVDAGFVDRALHHRSGDLVLRSVHIRRGALHGSDTDGGVILSSSPGSLTIEGSTVSDGSAGPGNGGGIAKAGGVLTATTSTLSGLSGGTGAAIALDDATAVLTHVTVAADGPGPALAGAGITASRTIVVSTSGGACATPFVSSTWNVVSDASCGAAQVGDPQLGPLAANGGPTPTRLPSAGSLAINAIPVGEMGACDASSPVDQRGVPRPLGAACDIGATEDDDGSVPDTPVLVVDDPTDVHDAVPGDGLCATAAGGCTLRAAVDEANNRPGAERIELTVDVTLSRAGRLEDGNDVGDLDVRSPVVLDGAGHRIDAGGLDRVFDVFSPLELVEVEVSGGSIADGAGYPGRGGGIRALADLTVTRSEIVGNRSVGGDGGGISTWRTYPYDVPAPRVTISDSTFTGNSAAAGGAMFLYDVAEPSTVSRTTISGNSAPNYAALDGPIHLVASTVADNTGNESLGTRILDVRGSILSATRGVVCSTTFGRPTSLGSNIVDDSCGFAGPGDVIVNALPLAPLAENGGPTRTRLAYVGGPSLDAVPVGTPGLCDDTQPTDQRGAPRPGGPGCDIGATEGSAPAEPDQTLTVNAGNDLLDLTPGDGICATSAGTCTLRAAIGEANARPGAARIIIGVNVTLSRPGANEDGNLTGDLDVTDRTRIEGGDRWVDAAGLDRVFHVLGGPVELVRVSSRGGSPAGGVRADLGHVVLERATISGNAGTGLSLNQSTGRVRASTISGNTSAGAGGVSAWYSAVRFERSTISGNAGPAGAGLDVVHTRIELQRSTIAGNTGSAAMTGRYGTVTVAGTVVASSVGACSVAYPTTIVSGGWNAATDASCGLVAIGDLEGVGVVLGPLAANGGPTLTHLLGTGSPLVDRIPAGTVGVCDAATAVDQRNVARPSGAGCDVGAVEGALAAGAPAPGDPAPPPPDPAP